MKVIIFTKKTKEFNMNLFKKTLLACAGIVSSLALLNCATIARGTTQTISVNSNISGATVLLDGAEIGKTPFSGKIKKNKGAITVSKKGYISQTISLEASFDWLASGVGNYFSFSTSGTTTDMTNGAAYMYEPSTYFVNLQEEGQDDSDFSEEISIRKFGMMNHSQIAIDAGKNGGEYTDALADLMKSKMDKEIAMQTINNALKKSKGDQIIFGNELIESFRN